MQADTLTLKKLFQKDVRYVIPMFQRPYVWTQEKQWEPLWEDVQNSAERYLEELTYVEANMPSAENAQALAEERAGTHFLGAIVLKQQATAAADIEEREIIDGQQRVTTLQVLLSAAQRTFETMGYATESHRTYRLVRNDYADGVAVFKVWPTELDQGPFSAVMQGVGEDDEEHNGSAIVEAYEFFRAQVDSWIRAAPDEEQMNRRVHGLETALHGLLETVVIDLGTIDDAFVIFETLNARGTPLLASELVKNFVLQTATAEGIDALALHESEWKPLEKKWWRGEIRQGRLTRPRIDVFLNYWLTARTQDEIPSQKVFPRFREYAAGKEISGVVSDIGRSAGVYSGFEGHEPWSRTGTFMYRWDVIDAGVVTPLLLYLFTEPDSRFTLDGRVRALEVLESFLVRRMICRLTSKNYNELFLELISRLERERELELDRHVGEYLAGQDAESRNWPSDAQLTDALVSLPLYRLLNRRRLRMILEALEDDLRTPKSEEGRVTRKKLTIEHLMPQKWHEHWPISPGDDWLDRVAVRDRTLNSIGNLTLVNKRLNPAMSNGPWDKKRVALNEHSVLYLNKEILRDWDVPDWNEDTIRDRSQQLAGRIARLWPRGDASLRG